MHQNEQLQKPFFAKFLESQEAAKQPSTKNQQGEQNTVSVPLFDMDHTLKFPSDGDEDIL